jgi:two-component system phosphate regulon sensor histidine kinase PhoR
MCASRVQSWLSAATLVVSAAWVVAWTTGFATDSPRLPLRLAALGVGLLLAGGGAAFLFSHAAAERREVRRHFESLCRLDPQDLSDDRLWTQVPPLSPGNSWNAVAQRLRETLLALARRAQEQELARTALEIRCQRASAEGDRIKAILAGLAEPVLAIDEFEELVLANRSAELLFGFELDRAKDRAVGQLLPCRKLAEVMVSTSRHLSTAGRGEELEIAGPRGQSQWFRAAVMKVAAAGRPGESETASTGAVAVLHDIAFQKNLQQRNAEFVSAVSHEMKAPLAGIKAYVELLADGEAEDDATREEFLGVIDGQADRLQRLVDNLLNLARIEAGVVQVNKQSRSLNELLEEAFRVIQPSAEAKRIRLAAELSPLYLGVLADRDMLLQAAINLLSNAVKYTPEGGLVTLRSRLVDDEVVFEVEDSGVGLSPEDCQRVFEKFYRVKKDKNMASGTGLGLPLAKHIVEDVHGGRITLQSTPGAGSTFTVTLTRAASRNGGPRDLAPQLIG